MDNWKKRRCFLGNWRKDGVLFAGFAVAMAVGVYCFLAVQLSMLYSYGFDCCLLDALNQLEKPWNFGIYFIPASAAILLAGRREFLYPAFVIKYQRSVQIWKSMFWSAVGKAALLSLIYSGISIFFSALSVTEVCNWSQPGSLFYAATETIYEGNAWYVLVLFLFFSFLKTALVALSLLLAEQMLGSLTGGILFWSSLFIVEWLLPQMCFFLNLFSIAPQQFQNPLTGFTLTVVGIGLLAVLYFTGRWYWREKEYGL